eukprot:1186150-Alexandrium_andersonii.AAC.1
MCHRGKRTERWSKHAQHPPRRPRRPTLAERVRRWLRDLTADGDVEPNPGPGTTRLSGVVDCAPSLGHSGPSA